MIDSQYVIKTKKEITEVQNYVLSQLFPWLNSRADTSDQEQKKEIEEYAKNHY